MIYQYENEEITKAKFKDSQSTLVYENIVVLILKGSKDAYKQVLEAGKPLENIQINYSSNKQERMVQMIENKASFMEVAELYYDLGEEKVLTWDGFMEGKTVTWSGTIADVDAMKKKIVVMESSKYNGEDWIH